MHKSRSSFSHIYMLEGYLPHTSMYLMFCCWHLVWEFFFDFPLLCKENNSVRNMIYFFHPPSPYATRGFFLGHLEQMSIGFGGLWNLKCSTPMRLLGSLYTRARGPFGPEYKNMWLVKKPKMIQVRFTLDLETLRDQRNSNRQKNPHDVKWIMLHGLPNITLSSSQRYQFNAKLGAMTIN